MNPEPGDLILYAVTPRSALSSRLIAIGELILGKGRGTTLYSHVALLDEEGYQLEARFPKIVRSRIDSSRTYEIWRIEGVTEHQRKELRRWAYMHLNEWYDLIYILSFGLIKIHGAEVCCLYAGDAYRHAGVHFPYATPDDIPRSKKAIKIHSYVPTK